MKRDLQVLILTCLLVCISLVFLIGVVSANQVVVVRIGYKRFAENQILAHLIYHRLAAEGYTVFMQPQPNSTVELRDMLISGEIDIYVEYTGTGIMHLDEQFPDRINEQSGYDDDQAFNEVSSYDIANNQLIWLPRAPGNNAYGLAVKRDFAIENDLTTVLDLAGYVNTGNEVMLSSNEEFCTRPDGLVAFYEKYGFQLSDNQVICIANGTPRDTLTALQQGENGTNVAMAFGTAAELLIYDAVILEDNLNAQYYYQPAPVVRLDVLTQHPDILDLVKPVFEQLDNRTLQDLNLTVSEFGQEPSAAALAFLIDRNFISPPTPDDSTATITTTCVVERPLDNPTSANIRSDPSLDSRVIGSMSPGVQLPVDRQVQDAEGYVWWHVPVEGGSWVREDTVDETGNCPAVPTE